MTAISGTPRPNRPILVTICPTTGCILLTKLLLGFGAQRHLKHHGHTAYLIAACPGALSITDQAAMQGGPTVPTLCCRLEVQAVSLLLLWSGVPDKHLLEEARPPREHLAVIQQDCGPGSECLCAFASGPKEHPAATLIMSG